MKHWHVLMTLLITVTWEGSSVQADPPLQPGSSAWTWQKWCQPGRWGPWSCPDNYCPKALPSIICPKWCGPHDYCPKTMPVPVRSPVGCGDDYLAKPVPCVPPPLVGPEYTCGPPDPCECPRKKACKPK